ncbi:MAG: hypothetical protein ABR499_17990, partial [Gemmatimonadaceae bacterium]
GIRWPNLLMISEQTPVDPQRTADTAARRWRFRIELDTLLAEEDAELMRTLLDRDPATAAAYLVYLRRETDANVLQLIAAAFAAGDAPIRVQDATANEVVVQVVEDFGKSRVFDEAARVHLDVPLDPRDPKANAQAIRAALEDVPPRRAKEALDKILKERRRPLRVVDATLGDEPPGSGAPQTSREASLGPAR